MGGRGFAALCAVLAVTAALIGAHPAVAVTTPNDPLFLNSPVCSGITNCVDQQWNLMSDSRGISADTAWDTTKGAGVTIAVIDSGLDFSHEDLKNQIWTNPGETGGGKENNGIDDDHNGYVDDWRGWDFYEMDNDPTDDIAYGHGTHTSGVAVAEQNNGLGGSGVAPEAKVMVLRDSDTYLAVAARLAQAIDYAVANGAQVISMSLGSTGTPKILRQAVTNAEAHGVVLVAATANEFSEHPNSPTWLDGVVGVGGIVPDTDGTGSLTGSDFTVKASYSNFGPVLDVVAPTDVYGPDYGGGYSKGAGTSNSTPAVAGVAALIEARAKALGITLSAREVVQILRMSATDLVGGPYGYAVGWDRYTGWGRVNAAAAVAMVAQGKIPPVADIDSPDWFQTSPDTSSVTVSGRVSARSNPYSWTLSYGAGDQPSSFTVIAGGSGTTPFVGPLGPFPAGQPNGLYTLDLQITDANGNKGEDRQAFVVLNDGQLLPGWPKDVGAGSVESSPQLANLDGTGGQELIVADMNGLVHAYRPGGGELHGWPVRMLPTPTPTGPVRAGFTGSPAIADLNGDGRPDVIEGGLDGSVYAWNGAGKALPGWPVQTKVPIGPDPTHPQWESGIVGSAAVGEVDGSTADGPEVVVGSADGKVYAFHATGTPLAGFPVLLQDPSQPAEYNKIASSPAIGDIDGDGKGEIVIGDGETYGIGVRAYAIRFDGTYQPGWPVTMNGLQPSFVPVVGTGTPQNPDLVDMNGDGKLEVVMGGVSTHQFVWNGDGTKYSGHDYLSIAFGSGTNSTGSDARVTVGDFSVGDVDGDGKADVVSLGVDTRIIPAIAFPGQIHPFDHLVSAWHGSNGAYLTPFPRVTEDWMFASAPILADVDGDGIPEMVIGNGDGWLHAYRASDGLEPSGWPKQIGQWLQASPAAGDFNGDGRTDIAVGTRQGQVFVFSTPGLLSGNDWPNLRGDPANTGVFAP